MHVVCINKPEQLRLFSLSVFVDTNCVGDVLFSTVWPTSLRFSTLSQAKRRCRSIRSQSSSRSTMPLRALKTPKTRWG